MGPLRLRGLWQCGGRGGYEVGDSQEVDIWVSSNGRDAGASGGKQD